jgi:uncharacterized protein
MKLDSRFIKPLGFDWDQGNKEKSWNKHKITIKESEEAFFNRPIKTFIDIKHSQKENRLTILGRTDENKKLYITFTIRNKQIRIISARKMSIKERRFYEK